LRTFKTSGGKTKFCFLKKNSCFGKVAVCLLTFSSFPFEDQRQREEAPCWFSKQNYGASFPEFIFEKFLPVQMASSHTGQKQRQLPTMGPLLLGGGGEGFLKGQCKKIYL
jgi:hypothetical protein